MNCVLIEGTDDNQEIKLTIDNTSPSILLLGAHNKQLTMLVKELLRGDRLCL